MVQSLQYAPHRTTAYDAEAAKLALARAVYTIMLSALAGTLLALIYLALAPPSFTATASLLFEPDAAKTALIENQEAILTSDAILKRVADRLNLAKDPDFVAPALRPGGAQNPSATDLAIEAAMSLRHRVRVARIAQSYILNVEATAPQPDQAALIAQAVAEAYLSDLTTVKTAQMEAASVAREKRLADLKDHVQKAQQLVEAFHQANASLTATDKLVPERRLAKLSSQLIDAREGSADKKASLDQIAKALRPGFNLADLPKALRTNAIEKLRDEYARLNRRAEALSSNLQDRDAQLADVRARLAEVETEIRADLKRKERTAQIDYQTATEHERELGLQRDAAASDLETANSALAKLAALDRELVLHRGRMEHELTEPQGPAGIVAPLPQARLLTPAVAPQKPSWPAPGIVVTSGLIGGLTLGAALAALLHWLEKTVRSRRDVSRATGLNSIFTIAPLSQQSPALGNSSAFGPLLAALTERDSSDSAYRHCVRHLLTQIRRVEKPGRPHTIGFTSPRVDAGTSATALAVAVAAAKSGDRVMLVDAAASDPELSQAFASNLKHGAIKAPGTKDELNEMVVRDAQWGFSILPLALIDLPSLGVQQQRRMVALLNGVSQNYDLVIIDAGAILADEGSAFLMATADQILVVAGAGVTTAADLALTMEALDAERARITGAVLTNALRPA